MVGCKQGVVLAGNRQTTDLARILDEFVRLLVGQDCSSVNRLGRLPEGSGG